MIRLNRYLAMCGAASRRKAEEILLQGRVRVNGKIVLLPSMQIEPDTAEVTLDGKLLVPTSHIYIVMNKPAGYVCAVSDKFDPVILELLPKKYRDGRVFPVGRLDRETEGLLILTNDGDFAHEITHPSFKITKEYEVQLDRPMTEKALARWKQGYEIEGRFVKPLELEITSPTPNPSLPINGEGGESASLSPSPFMGRGPGGEVIRITIGEGLKREVREMVRLAGFRAKALTRRKIGRLRLHSLKLGEFREISKEELEQKIHKGGDV